jgi:hypothetical protein
MLSVDPSTKVHAISLFGCVYKCLKLKIATEAIIPKIDEMILAE